MPAAKKTVSKKKGGSLEVAPLAAAGVLLVAQKMYKGMMAEEAAKPSAKKSLRKMRRGGAEGEEAAPAPVAEPTSYDMGETEAAMLGEPEAAAPAPEVAAPAPEAPAPAPEAPAPAAAPESFIDPETLKKAAADVLRNMKPEDRAAVIQASEPAPVAPAPEAPAPEAAAQAGGAKRAAKAKKGGAAGLSGAVTLGAELKTVSGGAKRAKAAKRGGGEMDSLAATAAPVLAAPTAAMAGGAKRGKSAKRGGSGALAPIAEVAGGMPMAPVNTAPLYPEPTARMTGGAKKAAAAKKKRMAGGELQAYSAQLSKLTSELRSLM